MAAASAGFLFAQAHVNEQAALLAGGKAAVGGNLSNGRWKRLVGHTAIVWMGRGKATEWRWLHCRNYLSTSRHHQKGTAVTRLVAGVVYNVGMYAKQRDVARWEHGLRPLLLCLSKVGHCSSMRGWIIFVCWLSVVFTGCDKQPKHSTTPDFQQTAIFQQRTPEGMALYLWPMQATDPQKIITLPNSERYELAPDGLHLAIYFGENIRVIDLITFEEVVLAEDVILPVQFIENISHQFLSWSPDGDKLAVLMGGPSWPDTSVINTTVVVLDVEQQSPDFVYDNGTFINEVAWSKDSTLVSFPEIEVPCDYIESCQEDEEEVIWRLTTLIHSGDNEWEVLSSRKLERVDETPYWEQHSICELDLSPTNELITYQSPCMLGYILFDRNGFIAPIQSSQPILPVLSSGYHGDDKSLAVHWLGETNLFLLTFRGYLHGVGMQGVKSYSILELSRKDEDRRTILSEVDLAGYNLASSVAISPDNQFTIHVLENNYVLITQLEDDLTMTPVFLEMPPISLKGLWLPEGYLTQSENKLVFIHPKTGEWEVVRDDLPEGFTLVGWQILE